MTEIVQTARRYWDRRGYVIAYVWLLAVTVVGFVRTDQVSDDVKRESEARSRQNCMAINRAVGQYNTAFARISPPFAEALRDPDAYRERHKNELQGKISPNPDSLTHEQLLQFVADTSPIDCTFGDGK